MATKFYLLIISLSFLVGIVSGQENLLTIEHLQDSAAVQPKATMLLVHTDWCTYCALQKKQLKDGSLVHEGVYFAEFNAEQKEDVSFKGEVYPFKPTGKGTGMHGLVEYFVQGKQVSFPLWVILDKELNVLDRYTGYLKPEELESIVKVLGEE